MTLKNGGIACTLGATPMWFLDNSIVGNANLHRPRQCLSQHSDRRLEHFGAGTAQDNVLTGGSLSLGSGSALRNTITRGGLTVGGSGGSIQNNSVGGHVLAGETFSVTNNTIGSLRAGNNATVDHNTVSSGGITVGNSALVTWNNVEGAGESGLWAGTGVTAQYNRLIGFDWGMTASTGLIEHNLIANNTQYGACWWAQPPSSITPSQATMETPLLFRVEHQ